MTNQDDKQVAAAIEDKPIGKQVDFTGAWRPVYSRGKIIDYVPLPFITAPTCCTERIVLEWVSDQPPEWVEKFAEELLVIIWGGIPQHQVREQLYEFVKFYKTGDHASAALEVLRGQK